MAVNKSSKSGRCLRKRLLVPIVFFLVRQLTSFQQDDFAQKHSSIFSDSRSSFGVFPNRTSGSTSHAVGIYRCTNLETIQKLSGQRRKFVKV